ncbi:integrase [Diaphorobacter sp. HDW4A]|uniref:integrase n=1 Tax=Diaphorobacter sp. HDW4A TaxID=2714924 RepID=UPI00140E7C69|nr:integrase [Diaphorobacter sp. HDW4A]QIL82961.1 integrase [Diaphorobacter sp. HDW4A]
MSAPVLLFTPKAELEPQSNLDTFINLCRQSHVLNAHQQFDKDVWNIGYFVGQNKVHRVIFSTLEASKSRDVEPAFPPPFLDFAKATIVYMQDKARVESQAPRIAALRFLEAALRLESKGSRPTAVDSVVLDTAVELAKKHASESVAYRVAGQLESIAELMDSKLFISLRQRWTHGMKKPKEVGSRISQEALKARQEKLPSAAALRALAGIFHQAVEAPHVLRSSFSALMLCAPERINEVLRLKRNCLVEGDGEFRGKLGLRWSGSKGFENTTKWLPSDMADIARNAIANLTKVTDPAHKLVAWYTANRTHLFLHEGAEHLRDQRVLNLSEVALILWGDASSKHAANAWAKGHKLKKQQLAGRSIGYLFEDVEQAVLNILPATFPYMLGDEKRLCMDAMAVMRTNELHQKRATYLCMFSCIDYTAIASRYSPGDVPSIFEDFKYTEDDGTPIAISSHSFRHYLNTLSQMGGMSSVEIAIFSGRKDIKQNCSYDHMTSAEVQAPISAALAAGFTSELEPVNTAVKTLFLRSEFKTLGLTAGHTTEYGWCLHDFASAPCQMYRDCINCEEQECVKGEKEKEENLRLLKKETEYFMRQARAAMDDEEYGADNWVKDLNVTLERVNSMLSILENPEVPLGARVRLDIKNAPLITNEKVKTIQSVKKQMILL